jgi:hypothetical protein
MSGTTGNESDEGDHNPVWDLGLGWPDSGGDTLRSQRDSGLS